MVENAHRASKYFASMVSYRISRMDKLTRFSRYFIAAVATAPTFRVRVKVRVREG
jgi:hypothetical protein